MCLSITESFPLGWTQVNTARADPKLRDVNGETPTHYACRVGDSHVLKALAVVALAERRKAAEAKELVRHTRPTKEQTIKPST